MSLIVLVGLQDHFLQCSLLPPAYWRIYIDPIHARLSWGDYWHNHFFPDMIFFQK
jgi:hypothetical protein